jgi:hypothetical protein
VHPTYPPLNRHPLYRPLTKRAYAVAHEQAEHIDPSGVSLPHAEAAHRSSILFHHSVLLGTRLQMDAIVGAFTPLTSEGMTASSRRDFSPPAKA